MECATDFYQAAFWWTLLALICVSLYAYILKLDLRDDSWIPGSDEVKQRKKYDPLPDKIEKATKTIDLIKDKASKSKREIHFQIIDEGEEVKIK